MSITPSYDFHPYIYNNQITEHRDALVTELTEPNEQNWIEPPVCRYFLNGNCRYGDYCRNSHVIQSGTAMRSTTTSARPAPPAQPMVGNVESNDPNNNNCTRTTEAMRNWIDAPEFVPRYITANTTTTAAATQNPSGDENTNQASSDDNQGGASSSQQPISYAQIVSGNVYDVGDTSDVGQSNDLTQQPPPPPPPYAEATLCPYIQTSITKSDGTISCKYGERCPYQHGELCDICGSYCLHPTDENQRKTHQKECMSMLEKDMEHSFAVARSKDKTCGICFEVITEKTTRSEHRFGILPNCNHIFCLPCIRKWRQAKNFDSTITRACPECRVESHYVCPSLYWVDTKEEKEKLLNEYKEALRQQNCKYFNRGEGTCPFGNKCFYKHALPNGELVDVGIPQQRRRYNDFGESNIVERVILWNFLQARDSFSDDDTISSIPSFTDPSDSEDDDVYQD